MASKRASDRTKGPGRAARTAGKKRASAEPDDGRGEIDHVPLFVFPPRLFPNRAEIRRFVRGPIGCCIDLACRAVFDSGVFEMDELVPYWRRHASMLLFDFGFLARAAANDDAAPLVVTFEGRPESEAHGDLKALHAAFEMAVASGTTPDYVQPLTALIARLELSANRARARRSTALRAPSTREAA